MDQQQQIRLRYAAAGLIKSLLRARCRQQPQFLTASERQRWGVEDVDQDQRSCASLLTRVRQLRARFEGEYLQGQDSIPAPTAVAAAENIDALIDQVASFLSGDLDEAIRRAARDEPVAWEELADWDQLGPLREALDRLPAREVTPTQPTEEAEEGPIAPDGFEYGGQPYELPAGLVFRLIDALWWAPRQTIAVEDLAGVVWDDHAAEITPGMIGSVRARANAAFKEAGLPFRVQVRKKYVRLLRS